MSVAEEDASIPEFEREVGEVQERLGSYLLASVGNAADADDLLQETNLVLWKKRADFESGTSFWAWAQRVAFFQMMAFRKRVGRSRLVLDDDVVHLLAADAPAIGEEDLPGDEERMEKCLAELPERQRACIRSHYYDRHSLKSIAARDATTVAAVGQMLYRARQNLELCLRKSYQSSSH